MDDQSQYLVLYPDEVRGLGKGPSSAIPSAGAATTAVDQYRTVAVASTNLPALGAAFTDVYAVSAISRVAEGGISVIADLEAAETALQALLLHDIVHVLIPSPKIDYGNGFVSYIRHDRNQRSQFGFDLFSLVKSRDWLVAPEFLRVADNSIANSTLPNSPLVGVPIDQISAAGEYSHDDAIEAINVTVESHGVPAYFTNPTLVRSRRGDGFSKRFYHHIRQPWNEAVGNIPPIVCTFSVPPLLAVVLDRLNNRADLISAVADLRSELSGARTELREFNEIVTQSTSTAEIEARIRHITQSFDAIVPESRLTNAERRQRRILSIQKLVRPLIKLAMGYVTKSGATLEDGLKVAGGARDLVIESRALIERTVTAQTFAGMLNTESVQSLVKHHFSEAEIASLEKSARGAP